MSAAPLLLASGVTACRPDEAGRPRQVLRETTLGVAAGELLAVVGPSGSGKSTLLRLFNRLLEPERGAVLLDGRDIRTLDPPKLRAQVPLVGQKPFLFPGSVADNLGYPARLRRTPPLDHDSAEISELTRLCRIDPTWLTRDAGKLSVGQQQRVCLARAMTGPCRALLLDEPTSALDRPTADGLAQSFRELAAERGLAVVVVTHDLRLAGLCADRVAVMLDGAVVEEGPAAQILNDPQSAAARSFLLGGPDGNEEEGA